jgi:hypothetical protein
LNERSFRDRYDRMPDARAAAAGPVDVAVGAGLSSSAAREVARVRKGGAAVVGARVAKLFSRQDGARGRRSANRGVARNVAAAMRRAMPSPPQP